jgi:hypothetical protein
MLEQSEGMFFPKIAKNQLEGRKFLCFLLKTSGSARKVDINIDTSK